MAYNLADLEKKKKKKYNLADLAAGVKREEEKLDSTFTDDIAPVGGNKDSWFKGGSFSDGYQFGDLTETILGTAGDFAVGAVKGVGRMVEGIVDLGTYGVAGVADLVGADEFADDAKEVAKYSATDEWTKPVTDYLDQYSVLGNKADAVSEGIGQVAAIILTAGAAGAIGGAAGLSSAGVAALKTGVTTAATGLSSMGSGMSEAYAGGATDAEAATYGLIAGIAEAGSELIFGGLGKATGALGLSKGISSLDDALAKKVSSKIANHTAKNFVEYGIKAGAEGAEEVASGIVQAIGKKVTYMSEVELGQLIEDENLLDSFIVGAITSGIAQSGVVPGMKKGSLIEANKEGTDFITGHTEIEQKVIDSVVAKTVAEREARGEKLSKKQLGEIEEYVESQLERGGISVDDIEAALGGEGYKGYKATKSKEASLKAEEQALKTKIDRLLEVETPTALDNAQYDQATAKLKKVQKELGGLDSASAKARVSNEVFNIVKGDRNGKGSVLTESYREVGRRREAFTADLSTVDERYKATYQRAIDSGVWNNTNKAHDFVDFVARQEAETGIQFDFTSTKKLAEAGYAVEGATINGVVVNGKITLNANSAKSLDTVVGHEITHVLEGTELYNALKENIIKYAKTKGEYTKRKKAIEDLYSKATEADVDIEAEVVADLVGDYLFTDEKFIKALSANKNVFQRVFDEIKHLIKMATAGSDEERQLLKVKRAFEKAYQELGEGKTILPSDSVKFNLSAVPSHKANLEKNYAIDSSVPLDELLARYDKILAIWERLGGKLDSKFLKEWNEKVGKDRAFSVFKKQDGYKYNLELSTLCKKGVPLFEAIDQIVKQEVMKELKTDKIGKAEKEILYEILKSHDLEIPCAICYVEQARQREGTIINDFLNGNEEGKLGWNQALSQIQERMAKMGVKYEFPIVDRSIATETYTPASLTMDEETQNAFYEALKEIANEQIEIANADPKKKTKLKPIEEITPEAVNASLNGRSLNIKMLRILFNNPNARFMMDRDLLYSSHTSLNLAKAHNDVYGLFNQQGGVGGYKTKQGAVVYWGDLLSKNWDVDKLRAVGGMRNQSNSDFQMYTLLDQAQMYIDLTAKGYYLHAYTKVLSEIKLFGLSGGKINASLIPKVQVYYNQDGTVDVERTMATAGLDENGDPIFDDIEGINHTEAFMLINDEEYSKSIGGICIGYSDAHILKLLDTKEVQLIIGFHDKTNDPNKRYHGAKYSKNYRGFNEAVDSAGKTHHVTFGQFLRRAEKMFGYDTKTETFSKDSATYKGNTYNVNDIPRLAAQFYLDHCASKGWSPAYSVGGMNFSTHENYYKLLADFSLYDSKGNYAPHKRVAYNMPDKVPFLDNNGVKQYQETETYIETELGKEMTLRDDIATKLADTSENGIIPSFIRKVNKLHEGTQFSLSEETTQVDSDTSLSDVNNVHFSNGVTQEIIDNYVEAAYTKQNHDDYKKYAEPTGRLIADVSDEVDIIGYSHALRDNDIRHIRNSHGENTPEKYPVTKEDIKNIPWLVENYDKVFVVKRDGGRTGIVYVKAARNGLVYYLEQVTQKYGNEPLLVNKQMIKTGADDIPDIKGLRDAIIKKQSEVEFLNDLKKAPQVYVQDVHQLHSKGIIPQSPNSVKSEFSGIDTDYMDAVNRGDMETAQKMVDEAAKKAGAMVLNNGAIKHYFHGTNAKFTSFDAEKARDGTYGFGFYFSPMKSKAGEYGELKDVYLMTDRIATRLSHNITTEQVNAFLERYNIDLNDTILRYADSIEEWVGYKDDMSIMLDLQRFVVRSMEVDVKKFLTDFIEVFGYDGVRQTNETVLWDNRLIKSADPVTYDDNGNVIPLSERFNSDNDDTRYSLSREGDIAPVGRYTGLALEDDIAPTATTEATEGERIARVLTREPVNVGKDKSRLNTWRTHLLDDASVFEDLSLATGNRELQAKFNYIKSADARGQYLIGNGAEGVSSLQSIKDKVDAEGMTTEFSEYMYHRHNIDRMSLEAKSLAEQENRLSTIVENSDAINEANDDIAALGDRLDSLSTKKADMDKRRELKAQIKELRKKVARLETENKKLMKEAEAFVPEENKPVFGFDVTAEDSQTIVAEMEAEYPWMKDVAEEVYGYLKYTRELLVENGLISRETADLWDKMYPHYVPIRRDGKQGAGINVPLNTNRTTVNNPVKRATGGNADILPMFDTIADRTMQTYRAVAKNSFGIELKNTLNSTIETTDEALGIDDIDSEELLQKGKNGMSPTFTVFEDGKRVTFAITEDMHEAMKPTEDMWQGTNKIVGGINNLRRGLITEYNPAFMLTNPIKDAQDVLMNSQHPAKTYANIPRAIKELKRGGKYATEYLRSGGEQNTYFDKQSKTFAEADKGIKKILGIPLRWISNANQFIERIPRLAEYIASRESGASIETAMLDAARVTTNFQAGGDITKWANRNGATFLNASVQGALQQVRNVREAKMKGLKGWLGLATKAAIAGLPVLVLNHLLWDDDEEYEELSDYVKDNYYIVAKYGEGKFVRIPKGRTLAVIQDAFEQMENAITGNDEVDFENFFELVMNNLAPNNPIDNNIIAPIVQAVNNETWYGEDLVPTRLQDLPEGEQYDESTDSISKWLGENLNVSPYKINYLLDQYSGGIGDMVLPMLTPEAESGNNSLMGNFIAPVKDKFTTDSTMNNQDVTDFYDLKDKLTESAKSSKATDEDKLRYKYINSVNSELSELYSLKREIQNSSLGDTEKYAAMVEVQKQINSLVKDSLSTYSTVTIDGDTAHVGGRYYRKNDEGEWVKLTESQTEKANSIGLVVGGAYLTHISALNNIKADTNAFGNSVSGSRKRKVTEYLNSLAIDYGAKLILYKTQYPSDDRYNYHIVEYLNGRSDITYEQMAEILTQLGMTIDENGRVSW